MQTLVKNARIARVAPSCRLWRVEGRNYGVVRVGGMRSIQKVGYLFVKNSRTEISQHTFALRAIAMGAIGSGKCSARRNIHCSVVHCFEEVDNWRLECAFEGV